MPPPAAAVLSAEQARLIEGPVNIMVGTCGVLRRPHVARAIGCCVGHDRRMVSVLLQADTAVNVLDDLAANGRIAVVFTEPLSNRSLQLKGAGVRIEPAGPGGGQLAQIWGHAYTRQIAGIAPPSWTPARLFAALVPPSAEALVAVSFTPQSIFEQSPGPSAGQALSGAAQD